ncbi:type II toxin-antitoxin system RelE/ParE family toxin [Bacteroides hominis]|uniref:type II toxin-antitoxin system RelE/ParE family toxin n=1 Tax=Bacteroides hominis TaxID=2763023 RepID=UPI0021067CBE|nr:type II toxin-antitoxin system RelE/ParE family toxin [Bacteroides hominis (ex Liu et al. 2022)]MCS2832200.1 type II toxin-antitoxin system RelE/ParE family toxin [Bacteroides fragilis]
MMKIAWTIQAQRRVIEILEYSQQEFGNKATDRLARTIEQKTLQLINTPFRGPL